MLWSVIIIGFIHLCCGIVGGLVFARKHPLVALAIPIVLMGVGMLMAFISSSIVGQSALSVASDWGKGDETSTGASRQQADPSPLIARLDGQASHSLRCTTRLICESCLANDSRQIGLGLTSVLFHLGPLSKPIPSDLVVRCLPGSPSSLPSSKLSSWSSGQSPIASGRPSRTS